MNLELFVFFILILTAFIAFIISQINAKPKTVVSVTSGHNMQPSNHYGDFTFSVFPLKDECYEIFIREFPMLNNSRSSSIQILRWLKNEGQKIEVNDPFVEVSINGYVAKGIIKVEGHLVTYKSPGDHIYPGEIVCSVLKLKNSQGERPTKTIERDIIDIPINETKIDYGNYAKILLSDKPADVNNCPMEYFLLIPRYYSTSFTNNITNAEEIVNLTYVNIINSLNKYLLKNDTNVLKKLNVNSLHLKNIIEIRRYEINKGYINTYLFQKMFNDYHFLERIIATFTSIYGLAGYEVRKKFKYHIDLYYNENALDIFFENDCSNIPIGFLSEIIDKIPYPTQEDEFALNKLSPRRWEGEFEAIKSNVNSLSGPKLKEQLEKLINLNSKNNNIKRIYFEASKLIYIYDIKQSLFYYALYYQWSKDQNINIKPLPQKITKKAFNKDSTKYEEFVSIINNKELSPKRKRDLQRLEKEIDNLFIIKRKKILLNRDKIKEAEIEHKRTAEKLGKILEDETVISPPTINQQICQSNGNLYNLESIHISLLEKFVISNYSITDFELEKFSKEYGSMPNSLVSSINERFFDKFDDNIIESVNTKFILNTEYYESIKTELL